MWMCDVYWLTGRHAMLLNSLKFFCVGILWNTLCQDNDNVCTWNFLYQVVEYWNCVHYSMKLRYGKYVFYGFLLKYCKKHNMDESDWLLELVIVPIYFNETLVIDVEMIRWTEPKLLSTCIVEENIHYLPQFQCRFTYSRSEKASKCNNSVATGLWYGTYGIISKLFVPKVKRNGFPFLPDFKIRS
jgi:hypothetical protein